MRVGTEHLEARGKEGREKQEVDKIEKKEGEEETATCPHCSYCFGLHHSQGPLVSTLVDVH